MSQTSDEVLLLTPGPTKIPTAVREASARATMHHRSVAFSQLLRELLNDLRPVFGTSHAVLPVHTTGRGAMEAAIANLCNPGDHIVSICNGKFGEMFATFAEGYGCQVTRLFNDWTSEVDFDLVADFLRGNPKVKAVTVVHSDTSSGVLNPIPALAQLTKNSDTMLVVDGISSIGSVDFQMDNWGVDVAITASQKGLMSFPGISFVVLNDKARAQCRKGTIPHFYTNFADIARMTAKDEPETPGTTPVSLVAACHKAVQLLHTEGLSTVQDRFLRLSALLRNRMQKLGFTLEPETISSYSPTLSIFRVPSATSPKEFRSYLLDKHNILIAGGLGQYNSTSVRVGHMGDVREQDIHRLIEATKQFVGSETSNYV